MASVVGHRGQRGRVVLDHEDRHALRAAAARGAGDLEERVDQLQYHRSVLGTVDGLFLEHPADKIAGRLRHRDVGRHGIRLGVEVRFHDLGEGGGVVGQLSRQHLVEQHTARVDVGRRRHLLHPQLLRGHVVGGAGQLAAAGQIGRRGDAEVGDESHLVLVDEDVLRLDVAVDDVQVVGGAQAAQHLAQDGQGGLLGVHLLAAEVLEQVVCVDVLHGDEGKAVSEAEIEALHDVAVADLAGQFQLELEALEGFRLVVDRHGEDLQRDDLVDRLVDGGADVAHGPCAEEALDAVAAPEDGARDEHLVELRLRLQQLVAAAHGGRRRLHIGRVVRLLGLHLGPLRWRREEGGRFEIAVVVINDERGRDQHLVRLGRAEPSRRIGTSALAAEAVDRPAAGAACTTRDSPSRRCRAIH